MPTKQTVFSALATCAAVLLVSAVIIGSAKPLHGCVLALTGIICGSTALLFIEE